MTDTKNIETALREALTAQSKREETFPRKTFYASSMGMCPRKQIAERAGLPSPKPLDQHSQFKMGLGTVAGRWVSDLLLTQGFLDPAWTEKRFELGGYSGRPDGYTARLPLGAIVEIKTVDDRAVKHHDLPEHYLWQALWYGLAAEVHQVIIFMVGRNQGLAKHQVVALTPEWKAKLTDEMAAMAGAWEAYLVSKHLPPCRHRFGWEDKWCAYREAKAFTKPNGAIDWEQVDRADAQRRQEAQATT